LWMAARPTSWKLRLAWKASETAGGGRSDNAIDVDEIGVGVFFVVGVFLAGFFEEGAEPEKVIVLVARGLIECDEQSVGIVDGGGEKGFTDEEIEFGEGEGR